MGQNRGVCPTCGRAFEKIFDYPLVKLLDLSYLHLEDVKDKIPARYHSEDLLEAPVDGWNRKLVPPEVLSYFRDHSDEEEMIHTDNFIYTRPKQSHQGRPDFYSRTYNHAGDVKAMISPEGAVGQYLQGLKGLVGQEIEPLQILPEWNEDINFEVYYIPGNENYYLNLMEFETRSETLRDTVILLGSKSAGRSNLVDIVKIGTIRYRGIVPSH